MYKLEYIYKMLKKGSPILRASSIDQNNKKKSLINMSSTINIFKDTNYLSI